MSRLYYNDQTGGNFISPTLDYVFTSGLTSTGTSTTTALTISPTSISASTVISLTAKVTSSSATGSVSFDYSTNNTTWTTASTVTLTSGSAQRSITRSATTYFRARYTASASNYANSTSTVKTLTGKTLKTITATYACTGARSYDGNNSWRTDTTYLYQGYYSSNWGLQRSIIQFPTTMKTDLSTADSITKVEIYLNMLFWGYSTGGTAALGMQSGNSLTSTSSVVSTVFTTPFTSKSGAAWLDISAQSGVTTLSNWTSATTPYRQCALYTSSTDGKYYGYAAGYGQTGAPQLRITYKAYV